MARSFHGRTCPLCEAMCGLRIELEEGEPVAVRGDPDDVFSRGYLCPKAVALVDLQRDPDRLRRPLVRRGGRLVEASWPEAMGRAADALVSTQRRHGGDAVAVYVGNPVSHSYSAALSVLELVRSLGTRNVFSAASVDHQPHLFAAWAMFGNKVLIPVPDIDRTQFLLVLGANPVVSNGSLMSAPGVRRRLQALRERGGRVVVVDPRRTRTAELADLHLPIRPGTDALLLLALVRTILAEGLARPGRLASITDGLEELVAAADPFPPERVAGATGLSAEAIRGLARDFAAAPSAVCYGRLGVCTQDFGGLCCWLMTALNLITGNLDRVGGAMLATPAVDVPRLAARLGESGSYDRWRSRVRGVPEFGGELPLAVLAEEIETPGRGQVRALVTVAGNPAASAPNAQRLDAAIETLDTLVSIDFYLNETSRHADVVLPGGFALERDHFDLVLSTVAVRNVVRYCRPLVHAPGGRDDWEILLDLAVRVGVARRSLVAAGRAAALRALTPRRVVALGLRLGPYGPRLSLRRLEREERTLDLGPLQPDQFPRRLYTPRRRISLAPEPMLRDLRRLAASPAARGDADGLLLIGRRQLLDNNSWMHNVPRLMRGRDRCTVLVHPADAAAREIEDGALVQVRSAVGSIVVPAEVTDAIRPGVVSIPHGYGHGRPGTRLRVANEKPGACVNDVTEDAALDELSGTSRLNGVPVTLVAEPLDGKRPVS